MITKRYMAFMVLLAAAAGFAYSLRIIGAQDELAIGLAFVPVLALFIWNSWQEQDRFYGMALPTMICSLFFSTMAVTIELESAFFEYVYVICLVGFCVSLLWVMSLLLCLLGSKTHPFA